MVPFEVVAYLQQAEGVRFEVRSTRQAPATLLGDKTHCFRHVSR